MQKQTRADFQKIVWTYYQQYGRHELPWRLPEPDGTFDAYKILVSEVMLQQTQVSRVIPKYLAFLEQFPYVRTLAAATLGEVLTAWSGLGYNRRAKFLWQAAQLVVTELNGAFPQTVDDLVKLPGVGRNTAGAVVAYAYNQPAVFIETNIRTVYIHRFFNDRIEVADREISQLVTQTIDQTQPRQFYWALMDYGSHLKSTIGNLNKSSKSYTKQMPFQGSKRQVRGLVVRLLTQHAMNLDQLREEVADQRLDQVLAELQQEQMIERLADTIRLR